MTHVTDLDRIRAADAHRVGPKVARLGELRSRGWRVPDGYAVAAQALADWLPAGADADPGRAREHIETAPLPAPLTDAIAEAHERLQDRTGHGPALRVAVRSSGIGEDGTSASFAGQYDTYLGVTGIGDVLAHIRKCWASGYSARAAQYRRRLGAARPGLAVGVLELVDAARAGVAFTLDPVTGDRGRLIVEANWGFGESVVSGHVSPDHWAVDRGSGEILERRTGATRMWSVPSGPAGRVSLQPLSPRLAGRACLADHEVRYICEAARQIEAAEGVPQDVEWAIAHGVPFPDSLFILQHRPETAWGGGGGEQDPGESAGSVPDEKFDPVQYALRTVFKVPGA